MRKKNKQLNFLTNLGLRFGLSMTRSMWHVFLPRLSYNEIRRSDPRHVFSDDTLRSDRPLLAVDVLLMVGSMWHFDPVQQISPSRGPLVWRCSSGDPCTPGQCSTGNTLEDSVEFFIMKSYRESYIENWYECRLLCDLFQLKINVVQSTMILD